MKSFRRCGFCSLWLLGAALLSDNAIASSPCHNSEALPTARFQLTQSDMESAAGTVLARKTLPAESLLMCDAETDVAFSETYVGDPPGSDGFTLFGHGVDIKIEMERTRTEMVDGEINSAFLNSLFGEPFTAAWNSTSTGMTQYFYTATMTVRRNHYSAKAGEVGYRMAEIRSRFNTHTLAAVIKFPTPVTCNLQIPKTVHLKAITATDVNAAKPGEQIGEGAQFSFGYTCNVDMKRVVYKFTDNSGGGRKPFVSLAPSSTASGVELRLRSGNTEVPLGDDHYQTFASPRKHTDNQLSVAYVRNARPVKPGTVRAGVTLTVDYE